MTNTFVVVFDNHKRNQFNVNIIYFQCKPSNFPSNSTPFYWCNHIVRNVNISVKVLAFISFLNKAPAVGLSGTVCNDSSALLQLQQMDCHVMCLYFILKTLSNSVYYLIRKIWLNQCDKKIMGLLLSWSLGLETCGNMVYWSLLAMRGITYGDVMCL